MQCVVAHDILSPSSHFESYHAINPKSIPIMIFRCDNTEKLSAGSLLAALNTQTDQ